MKKLSNQWQRLVIKVGSSLIAPQGVRCSAQYLLALVDFIEHCHRNNKQVILVSSGSVAAGAGITQTALSKPFTIPQKQALAAIGQSQVMQHWQKFFDRPCAQILLTRSDLENEKRLFNARNTIEELFRMGAIPIINENDSVVVDELVVGDNDNLAARVAVMCRAQRLIICSDVDGLFDKNPVDDTGAKLVSEVFEIERTVVQSAMGSSSSTGTGGMITKLQAAKLATGENIETLIVNGKNAETFENLKLERNPGTIFYSMHKSASIVDSTI